MIPWKQYAIHFASDRRHMRKLDGSWKAPPPPWPCIVAEGTAGIIIHLVAMLENAFLDLESVICDMFYLKSKLGY